MKAYRKFIDNIRYSDSYVSVTDYAETIELRLADCNQTINWTFKTHTPRHIKKAMKKLAEVEKVIAMVRTELTTRLERHTK